MRILAFTKYGSLAASTRQRFIQYEPLLAQAGISVDYSALLDNDHLQRLVQGRRASPLAVARSYFRRAATLLRARRYDLLWVHCEFFPYLPGFVESAAGRIGHRPIVFDYDDAIFHMYDAAPSPLVRSLLGHKLEPVLRRAKACLCGNDYVRDYARRFNDNAVVLPTVVDTDIYRPGERAADQSLTIGWIGSPSTWQYVRPLLPLLSELCVAHRARLLVVGAGAAAEGDRRPAVEFVPWSEETEVASVQEMDIGIMPLPDEPWARGKSGYKLIQYMACGLPVVASPVGVNATIVRPGEEGLLATTEAEWRDALETLLADAELRARMGSSGRKRAIASYSLQSQAPRLIEVLRKAAA